MKDSNLRDAFSMAETRLNHVIDFTKEIKRIFLSDYVYGKNSSFLRFIRYDNTVIQNDLVTEEFDIDYDVIHNEDSETNNDDAKSNNAGINDNEDDDVDNQ